MARFHRNTKGLIRGLKRVIEQLQRADAREQAKADAHSTLPVLFASTVPVTQGLATLKTRCEAALMQR